MLTAANRLWERKHEKVKPDLYGRRPNDGTSVWVAPAEEAPDDTDFLGLEAIAEAGRFREPDALDAD